MALRVPVAAFGPGSRRQFTEYLQGESQVRVGSIDDIVEWLLTCEYTTDIDLFHESDWWQHPSSFEQLRRGDCEDFALWAWRKLVDIGVEAEFYVGRVQWGDETGAHRQHAWVVYRISGADFLFEPAARSRPLMIRELADARVEYVPHFAIDRRLRTFAFVGCVLDGNRVERRRDPGAGPARDRAPAAGLVPHEPPGAPIRQVSPESRLREMLEPLAQRTDRPL